MNRGVKRFRQTSIKESFAFSKRPKSSLMEEATCSQAKDDSPVNKSPSENPDNLQGSETIGHSLNKDSSAEEFCDNRATKSKKGNSDAATITSKSIIDQLLDAEDGYTQFKNNNNQTPPENVIPKSEIDEPCEEEGSYKSSADLFPDEPSLEDDPVPSFSSSSQESFNDSQKELFGSCSSAKEDERIESSFESEPDNTVVLNRSPDCDMPLPKLEPLENHSIMFSPHIRAGDAPLPFPKSYRDKWDSDHVRMPCSPFSKCPDENPMEKTAFDSRWELICESLLADIGSSEDLERAIMRYNSENIGNWNFRGLHSLINQHWKEEERDHFFESILPAMIEMALSLPDICTQPVPFLKRNKDHSITMSQKQIGCLLLNAFFCTFPHRNTRDKENSIYDPFEFITYPDINFNRLFYGTKRGCLGRNAEKLKCLINYFRRIVTKEPSGTVTFHRQVILPQDFPNWYSSTRGLRTAIVKSHGLIEDDGRGMLQVDFANKYIGGGVLNEGCVQEEIRFVICPELIVSRLFVEVLEYNEALIITGVEQFNKYSGYGDTFKWEGDFVDNTPRDSWGRRCTKIAAIDATCFRKRSNQFKFQIFKRELNKAYCGFYEDKPPNHLAAVATGNWGCGAFRGSATFKFLIQLMAASECKRNMVYYTFQNRKLKKEMEEMYEFLSSKNVVVGDLWRLITDYTNSLCNYDSERRVDLYSFIYSQFRKRKVSHQQEKKILINYQ